MRSLIGATFCSGIGAPEAAAPGIDWRFASEIEAFPRTVLQERFGLVTPDAHNRGAPLLWGDMTTVTPETFRTHGLLLPDVIVAGTPCQAFSLAGLRGGLSDARGNLTLKFVEICHAIQDAAPDRPFSVVWENVPGALNHKDNPFGCLLGGLVGADDPLPQPDGIRWPGIGMVSGPRARAAWRVLDAKYFGVPQRRRRIFLVASFGGGSDPAEVLFEPGSGSRNPPARKDQKEDPAGDAGSGAELAGHEDAGLSPVVCVTGDQTHSLTDEGCDASEDGMGRGTPIVAGARCLANAEGSLPDGYPFLTVSNLAKGINNQTPLIVSRGPDVLYGAKDFAEYVETPESLPLRSGNDPISTVLVRADGSVQRAVAYDMRGREGGAQMEGPHDTANMRASSGGSSRSYVADAWTVRRLTPTECHRLQGFDDDHCRVIHNGKPAKDTPVYKALGNSMAVPVMTWILSRLTDSITISKENCHDEH